MHIRIYVYIYIYLNMYKNAIIDVIYMHIYSIKNDIYRRYIYVHVYI